MQKGAKKAVLPVKIRDISTHSDTSNHNGEWEPRYVDFGKDSADFDAFELDLSPGLGAKPNDMERM